jgi:hypothetical protein
VKNFANFCNFRNLSELKIWFGAIAFGAGAVSLYVPDYGSLK